MGRKQKIKRAAAAAAVRPARTFSQEARSWARDFGFAMAATTAAAYALRLHERKAGAEPEPETKAPTVNDARWYDAQEPGRGRHARRPTEIPPRGWIDVLWRVLRSYLADRIGFVAGAVTFFTLLSMFPALTAFVSLYGLFNDVQTVNQHLSLLYGVLPQEIIAFVGGELTRLATGRTSDLGLAFAGSLLLSFWSAAASVKALFNGLNIAYHEAENRNLLHFNLITLGFTLGALVFVLILVSLVVATPIAFNFIGWSGGLSALAFLRWPLLFLIYVAALSLLYRYGPCRARARWTWLTGGGIFAAATSVGVSAGFSWYLRNIANFDATYGSLGAIMGFMLWTWLSVNVVLIGAKLNAEAEHQTARDTTVGPEEPLGRRGALVADTVGARLGAKEASALDLDKAQERAKRMAVRQQRRQGPPAR